VAYDFLYKLRVKHPLHSGGDIFNGVINDFIKANVDLLVVSHGLGRALRPYVKRNDNSVRRRRKHDVRLSDAADAAMNRPYPNLVVRKTLKRVFNRLDRTGHVGLNHNVKVFNVT
jgi:hypothetical protein